MATSRPFAYNTGSQILGTIQVGSLAVGTPTSGFTSSPQFWNGADEDLGYVIAQSISANTQPTPISGVTASLGFNRSSALTESSFVQLTNYLFNQSFTGGTQAKSYLNDNGYWTSYPCVSPTISTTSLLAYYALENNGNDSSGNGYNLTTAGSVNYVSGKNTIYAALCNNSNYLYQTSYNFPSAAMSQQISAVMWVKTSGITSSSFATGSRALLNYYISADGNGWNIFISKGSDNQFTYGCRVGSSTIGRNVLPIGTWPYNNTWIQLAMTYTGGSWKLYLNGVETISSSLTRTINQTSTPLAIQPGSSGWNATYDEVSIWNRVLTASEITTLYNTTCPLT